MRRVMLLAIGLCALLWSAGAPAGSVAADGTASPLGITAQLRAGDSDDSSEPGEQWRARHHTMAVTVSVWKSAPVHAAHACTPSQYTLDAARASRSSDHPAPSAPRYLRHTPLLI